MLDVNGKCHGRRDHNATFIPPGLYFALASGA